MDDHLATAHIAHGDDGGIDRHVARDGVVWVEVRLDEGSQLGLACEYAKHVMSSLDDVERRAQQLVILEHKHLWSRSVPSQGWIGLGLWGSDWGSGLGCG